MCGIAGYVSKDSRDLYLEAMVDKLDHRGPDMQNTCTDLTSSFVGLGHTRLSIQDLSSAGNQPMQSSNARYVISYNGEIYNFQDIKKKLDNKFSISWKGYSDTEVLLNAISFFGLHETLNIVKGMFAFALLDKKENTLVLTRDPFGEKPLYFSHQKNTLIFASELKALKVNLDFEFKLCHDSLSLFLRYNSIPAPHTPYSRVSKLEPGNILLYDIEKSKIINNKKYIDLISIFNKSQENIFDGSYRDAQKVTEKLLIKSVIGQLSSDVPLGCFLSGGIDSSMIAALMQENSIQKIDTFSIGFENKEFDESAHARTIANHLQTNHHEMIVSPADSLEMIPILHQVYDEPFADSSQIPTLLLSQFTSKHVSVALSGDGADELFGGYNRYLIASKYWKLLSNIPHSLRTTFKKILSYLGPNQLKALAFILKESNHKDLMLKLEKFLKIIDAKSIESYHLELCSQLSAPTQFLASGTNSAENFFSLHNQLEFSDPIMRMMAVDSMHYLPTDILTKVDRAAMNYSLETRIPYLDLDLFKFVASLPMKYKVSKNTKYILRELAYKKIPKNILDKPKMGFGVPIKDWLRDELSDWANDLLSSASLSKTSIFHQNSVDNLWHQHVQLKSDNSHQLWNILMLQSWLLEHANEY